MPIVTKGRLAIARPGGVGRRPTEHVYIDLPILDSIPEILHVELVSQPATILFKTAGDFSLLLACEKLGRGRIIIHDEESSDSND